jgi:hypothetical protein
MRRRSVRVQAGWSFLFMIALWLVLPVTLDAQGRQGGAGQTKTPKEMAPQDLTGYWVSVVTEDWRFRMVVPDKGDYGSATSRGATPLNAEGRKVADAWDPAKDQANGNECRSYGAAAIMAVPGRLHIYWQDDSTLRIDTDSGTQTRLLHFGGSVPQNETSTWQGYSTASWEFINALRQEEGGVAPGRLKVVTTHMLPGYLRKNGVPYSGNATLEEYFERFSDPYVGDTWLEITRIVTDPQYLYDPFVTSMHFKKIPDASGWDLTPCRADQPR